VLPLQICWAIKARRLLYSTKPIRYAGPVQGKINRLKVRFTEPVTRLSIQEPLGTLNGRNFMRLKTALLLLTSTALIAPAAAQNGPPSAASLLQAADKAIGASSVKSFTLAATGWMGYPGQQFAQGDLPHSDLKSYNFTGDFPSKSAKWAYVRVQGNNGIRGGGSTAPLETGTSTISETSYWQFR
jgi:hypothetical protein